MGNIGMAVSQPNYDVKDSADRFKVFSSSFQTLKVFNTYAITTTKPSSGSGDTNTATATHNLGYFCPYLVIYNGNTTEGVGASYFFTDSEVPLLTRGYTDRVEIDVDEYFDSSASDGDTIYFTVYVFLDDFRAVAESSINSTITTNSTGNNYGIKVSKSGYKVKEATDEQLILSSAFPNQVIHKKGISTAATISHNLGYIPNFIVFNDLAGNPNYIEFTDPASSGITDSALTLIGGANNYYIIFKDKLN